jgi:hypothetical protein
MIECLHSLVWRDYVHQLLSFLLILLLAFLPKLDDFINMLVNVFNDPGLHVECRNLLFRGLPKLVH